MTFQLHRLTSGTAFVLALSGCALQAPPTYIDSQVAPAWHAPMPHGGDVTELANWWQRQGDPVLVELIEAAQTNSPTVAQAVTRMQAARATQAAAGAALIPNVGLGYSATRGINTPGVPLATVQQGGLQAAWELDLVGAGRIAKHAAQAQFDGRQAQWHEARVSVAAEVAHLYYSAASCQKLLSVARRDAASRSETASVAAISAKAGFTAPSVAALARAAQADASSRVTQQFAACEQNVKALVALTALPELDLRQKLALSLVAEEQLAPINVANLPADLIRQRPDIYAAERDIIMASAQVAGAQAQRYPSLSLNGSIGALRSTVDGVNTDLHTWSFGPLALTLPLFDGGRRVAQIDAMQAAYQESVLTYRAKVRQAVREVEEALVKLHSTQSRAQDARTATQGYQESLAATQARYSNGLASLVELEDARRAALAAQTAQLNLQLERQNAWVSLYRAVGGGWSAEANTASTPTAPTQN